MFALSRLRLPVILLLVFVVLAGCTGGGGSSNDRLLITNRARVIQTSNNIESVLPYIYDPLEISLKLTTEGRPFCDHPLAAPECIDEIAEPVSHYDLLDYADLVAIEGELDSPDVTLSDMTVTVSGNTARTSQTYTIHQYEIFGDGRLFDVAGKYETTWTKVNGEWKLFKIHMTMDLS